tara:strand:+ start:185 stop:490 length:306 start_codon:yes stop_codon:yes gene_type:complete
MNNLPEYRFAENPSDDSMGAIRITNGKFKGFTYQYGVVSLDEENDTCKVNFTYQIIDNEKGYPVNKELVDIMGGILTELINERYDDGSDYRDNYPDKSDSE